MDSRVDDPDTNNNIVVAEITRVEAAAALAARHRACNGISLEERDKLLQLMLQHFDTEYDLIPLTAFVISQAVVLTQRYRLRGYDAVQLAIALDTNNTARDASLPDIHSSPLMSIYSPHHKPKVSPPIIQTHIHNHICPPTPSKLSTSPSATGSASPLMM